MTKTILVTGGAGFIGSNFILDWIAIAGTPVVNLDKLTYAGNLNNLAALANDERYCFVQGDIADRTLVRQLLARHNPRAVVHLAAETHVDRSIHNPEQFIQTNVLGTFQLLDEVRDYRQSLPQPEHEAFRFLHISTDEVFGSLEPADPPFTESSPYAPNSPYAASKAASSHLVRAYHQTYGLPTLTIQCSNNYGPYQFMEKLIPLMVLNALKGKKLPVYGDGQNIRDWLYVGDHCTAIRRVLEQGRAGETYNVGGRTEKTTFDVVETICTVLDELRPAAGGAPYSALITLVGDRRGHDRRYAVDPRKLEDELGWRARTDFASGIRATVRWYLDNAAWVQNGAGAHYESWLQTNYNNREQA